MKRLLVTVGTGFMGSCLSERLVKEGNNVICLDYSKNDYKLRWL